MNLRTTNFDAIATAVPLNREASTVRDGSGDFYDFPIPLHVQHWKAPPTPVGKLGKGAEDLTGRVFGRLTVIRFHGSAGGEWARPIWLVRCACGDYEVRRSKTLRSTTNADACCCICQHVKHLRDIGSKPNTKARRMAAARLLDHLGETARADAPT